jgi:hypothetical protein
MSGDFRTSFLVILCEIRVHCLLTPESLYIGNIDTEWETAPYFNLESVGKVKVVMA